MKLKPVREDEATIITLYPIAIYPGIRRRHRPSRPNSLTDAKGPQAVGPYSYSREATPWMAQAMIVYAHASGVT